MKARVHNMLPVVFIFTWIFVVHQDKLGHQNLNYVIELNSHLFFIIIKRNS